MKRVLLLNPPGRKFHIRDLFCGKTSKTRRLNHPLDLLMLSGRLSECCDVGFIDAIAEGLTAERCRERIIKMQPDVIVWFTGIVSYREDFAFMRELRASLAPFVSVSLGDVFFENGSRILEQNDFIDAVLCDYVSDDIIRYLDGEYTTMHNVLYRHNGKVIDSGIQRDAGKEYTLPPLFINKRCIFPFIFFASFLRVREIVKRILRLR